MSIGIERILQVKIPVSDLPRSVAWYRRVFDLRLGWEFVEDGVARGAVLVEETTGSLIGLRHREMVPGQPSFAGFDLFSFGVAQVVHPDAPPSFYDTPRLRLDDRT